MSNIFSHQSFCVFSPSFKPYSIFPFRNKLIFFSSRSRSRNLFPIIAQSSSEEDIVLLSTTEHRDGSLVFRFGAASEVVENDDVVEEIESKSRQQSSIVKVLDGDQEREVIVRRIESGAADADNSIDETETKFSSDPNDSHEESSDILSDIYEEEVLSSQPEDKQNNSLHVVHDETDSIAQLHGDETSNPTISLVDNNSNIDKSSYTNGTLVKDSKQISKVEAIDVGKPYESDKVKSEDTGEGDRKGLMPSTSVPVPDIELTDVASEDIEEVLQDKDISEGTFIDEMPPSDLLVEPSLDKVKVTTEVSSIEAVIVTDQVAEDKLQEVNTNNKEDNDVSYVVPVSCKEEAELTVEQEEVSRIQSAPVELKPTMKVSDIELEDIIGSSTDDDGILQVTDESEDPSVFVKLETIQVSDIEIQDTMGPDPDDGILKVTDKSEDPSVFVELEPIQVSDNEIQDTMGPDPDDGILQATDKIEDPSVSDIFKTIQVSDIEVVDITSRNSDDEILQMSDESEDPSVSVELETNQVSDIEVINVTQPYSVDKLDKVETEDTNEGDTKDLLPPATIHDISGVEPTDVANEDMEERLQDIKISEGTLIDGMLSSDSIGAEPTVDKVMQLQSSDVELEAGREVSTTNGMDVKDWSVDDELQQVSIDNRDEIDVADVMTFQEQDSIRIELKPTVQVSDVEIQDAIYQNLDDGILQAINEETGDSLTMDVEHLSHKLEGQLVQDEVENHSISEQCVDTDALEISILLKQDNCDPLPEAEKTEENVCSSELAEASEESALLLATEVKVKREEISLTGEFLSSGAAFLEHPFKALTGGDDAYFVAGGKWLGVANGVSQWSFEGTNAGAYAQELMKTCEDIVLNTRSVPVTNPVELLCSGIKETDMSGSSNVLVANFDGQALHVANIGDTGFLIIRHGAIYKKSSPLLHEFHFALQVEDSDDPLQLMEEYTIELEEGDIVVSATDGLFDNLYEREIAMIVSKSLKAEMRPQEIANVLATRAQEVGKSAFVRSPFSDAAQAAGYSGYTGGKPDNVVVIVSLVEKRSNLLGE